MESSEDSAFIVYLELLIDMMFFIDMCINFLTAFEDRDQRLESRIKEIAINYLSSWFLLDLVSCIPFQYLDPQYLKSLGPQRQQILIQQEQEGDSSGVYQLLRSLRLFKLIRLIKYNRNLSKFLQHLKMEQGVKRMI